MVDETPEAYRIGWVPFLGLHIDLSSRPLIPRVETEWWTERLIAETREASTYLDLCAGSGAIGCAILKDTAARVSFGEIDVRHEATIRTNIRINKLDEGHADIRIGDLFAPFQGERFDVIVANPPYVPSLRTLPESVANFEPSLALRGGVDGLDVIRRIASSIRAHLTEKGRAWIECDSEYAEEARRCFVASGFRSHIRVDQYGAPRVIVVS